MDTGEQIAAQVREFVVNSFLFGDDSRLPSDEQSLLETGVVDSTGVLEIIEWLESEFAVTVADDETTPDNLGSIANLSRFLRDKSVTS